LRLDRNRVAVAQQLAALGIERMAGEEKLHKALRADGSFSLKDQAFLTQK